MLHCIYCEHRMHAKRSIAGLRYFAHDLDGAECSLGLETMEHRLLKLQLASAIRAAGHQAELEVPGPDGRWRADVLATTGSGRRMAWQAQMSSITTVDARRRTANLEADAVTGAGSSWKPTARGSAGDDARPRPPRLRCS
ncbi:hypothetical protein OG883_17195 [Streptomyces sp. NBC_01142]|uniref:competence protein CoiA family protein n=1 Tax=Streptomyces sp. NBC_01142 TaxID=2975865 RepID=UPI002250E754|nr:hypothetical protein [Streptomyces sp. NBC_01142]MCX4821595.1 hypothetical protein [Streptomyces sp. NBC_01142]